MAGLAPQAAPGGCCQAARRDEDIRELCLERSGKLFGAPWDAAQPGLEQIHPQETNGVQK